MAESRPEGAPGGERRINRVTVTIFGENHRLCGEEPAPYLQELAARVDARMHEISKANQRLAITEVAVLAALHATSEWMRLEEQYQRVLSLLEREWERRKLETSSTSGPSANRQRPTQGEAAAR